MDEDGLLGIVGGVGPESTIDYYRSIVAEYQRRRGDGAYPRVMINSVDAGTIFRHMLAAEGEAIGEILLRAVRQLADAGAGVAAIAFGHDPHRLRLPRAAVPDPRSRVAAVSAGPKGSAAASSHSRSGSERNHVACRFANWRLRVATSSIAASRVNLPSSTAQASR